MNRVTIMYDDHGQASGIMIDGQCVLHITPGSEINKKTIGYIAGLIEVATEICPASAQCAIDTARTA